MTAPIPTAAEPVQRLHLRVAGVVQGVGFRPFVYGLARRHGLGGFVGNDSAGVFIEVEGPAGALAAFRAGLLDEKPPLAHIESVCAEPRSARGETTFAIAESQSRSAAATLVSPDVCLCDDCRRELFNPADRRYRYAFINCTNCGPRFTIIRGLPYDRPLTSMAAFEMCPKCAAEYHDPLDRRFHAQPNACPVCGPRLWLEVGGRESAGAGPVAEARALIEQGQIVAVKGLGGFHLACDAASDAAVGRLRERKGRAGKPLAVMVFDLEAARAIAQVSEAEARLLTSRERPIVLLRRRPGAALSALVAPGNAEVGVMLAYTPLHYLLLEGRGPLVMTSGNISDEPIVKDNDEARERLAGLADAFLMHNRDIETRCDDSVMRVFEGHDLPVRRSRGYAPFPVALPFDLPPVLAAGGELKATFCLARGRHAFMSQHIGDMENLETLQAFEQAVERFTGLFGYEPEAFICDLHPRYLGTRWAQAHAAGGPCLAVQHHHAHIAAVMAENGWAAGRSVIGFSFDGTGYGDDGAIWGGEVLLAGYDGYRRAAHLKYVTLPGGDASIRRPYRAALAHLRAAGLDWADDLPGVAACPPAERAIVERQLQTGLNSAPTSSVGRLFDAAAALIGVRTTATYEAQPAIELEALADPDERGCYEFEIGAETFDAAPVFRALAADWRAGLPAGVLSARLHNGLAELVLALSLRLRREDGLATVALSGGVFQNITLLKGCLARLRPAGFEVLIHRQVPPNDGGLALGQAVIGGRRLAKG